MKKTDNIFRCKNHGELFREKGRNFQNHKGCDFTDVVYLHWWERALLWLNWY